MTDDLQRAYDLFHEAIPQFIEMKIRGIKVDQKILAGLAEETTQQIRELETTKTGAVAKAFKKKYGKSWDAGSGQSKQRMFFGIMQLDPTRLTPTGTNLSNPEHCSTDADSLRNLLTQVPANSEEAKIINACLNLSSLVKLNGYITGFTTLSKQGGYLHPWFNLGQVRTYRSSSNDPNFQNIPVRIPAMARLRTCLVPRFDGLMELDFGGAELCGIGTLARDKNLGDDLRAGVDIHRRYAAMLHELSEDEIDKEQRFNCKTGFIFPECYGSYWGTIANNYPQWAEETVRDTEAALWKRYSDVRKWQKQCQANYERTGELWMLSGFRTQYGKQGLMSKNNVLNDSVQGFAFHRLLRVLMDIEYEMRHEKMQSIIIGQIHDSVVFDYVKEELPLLVDICEEMVTRPAWDFDDVVPWKAEFKIGKNMLEMQEI